MKIQEKDLGKCPSTESFPSHAYYGNGTQALAKMLLPCPFCGEQPFIRRQSNGIIGDWLDIWCECGVPNFRVREIDYADKWEKKVKRSWIDAPEKVLIVGTLNEVLRLWNRRLALEP